ncbi:hypothetical protein X798_02541 [Onchocerca flexuosa]|uniref:Uncharacterized protein n=1 Tax=Onchocerca flexuosa TaxID=387005 RepID=A0A238BYZ1_9BILA|nr:hypothetical protein X798_02541 [Onchocerca flexuosa]
MGILPQPVPLPSEDNSVAQKLENYNRVLQKLHKAYTIKKTLAINEMDPLRSTCG